jgi:hypothetical protein
MRFERTLCRLKSAAAANWAMGAPQIRVGLGSISGLEGDAAPGLECRTPNLRTSTTQFLGELQWAGLGARYSTMASRARIASPDVATNSLEETA